MNKRQAIESGVFYAIGAGLLIYDYQNATWAMLGLFLIVTSNMVALSARGR